VIWCRPLVAKLGCYSAFLLKSEILSVPLNPSQSRLDKIVFSKFLKPHEFLGCSAAHSQVRAKERIVCCPVRTGEKRERLESLRLVLLPKAMYCQTMA